MCLDCQMTGRLSRRHFLALGGAAIAASQLPLRAQAQTAGAAPNAITPDEALKRIMEGNARYASNTSTNKDFSAGRAARAAAQFPIAGIVSCADARVAPELAFDQGPGELFVVRVAGNFVNDDGLASIEYGVKYLGVPVLMVLGHTGCGAVGATIKVLKDNVELPGHLPGLVNAIKPAVEAAEKKNPSDLLAEATAENVRFNVKRLATSDKILSGYVKEGKLKVVGGIYDIATGKVDLV